MSCSKCVDCGDCKPTVSIKNAKIVNFCGNDRLTGFVENYPANHGNGTALSGEDVVTSTVLRVDENTVETKNTIYKVESWA